MFSNILFHLHVGCGINHRSLARLQNSTNRSEGDSTRNGWFYVLRPGRAFFLVSSHALDSTAGTLNPLPNEFNRLTSTMF